MIVPGAPTTSIGPDGRLNDAFDKTEDEKELQEFKRLQDGFAAQFETAFPDKMAGKTVVIVPSLTLDVEILSKLKGAIHYEERLLCLLMLLRMPHTHVIYVTSMPVDDCIMDYYLHLLPGITGYHARQRLTMLSCFDASPISLTQKILDRPRLIQRIKDSIPQHHLSHMACFNVTPRERALAVRLGMPIYGCDPGLEYLGSKSFSRRIFRTCGIPTPDGMEDLYSEEDIIQALTDLKEKNPDLRRAVVKINEGFSGEGNAIFSYEGADQKNLHNWIRSNLTQHLSIIAKDLSYQTFMGKFSEMGGVVEIFIEGGHKESPSAQCRITPLGRTDVVSTHDQLLGGEGGQVFLGAHFPASPEYAPAIGEMGFAIAEELKRNGVLGRFAIDFISVKEKEGWKHYAIEINLRKGGTTHPYLMLQFLTDGDYDMSKALYYTANGQTRYYFFSDNLQSDHYKGLTPHDLIDIAMCNGLLYDGSSQQGVMFHMIGALSQYGKLGVLCIGETPEIATQLYKKTVQVLDKEKWKW